MNTRTVFCFGEWPEGKFEIIVCLVVNLSRRKTIRTITPKENYKLGNLLDELFLAVRFGTMLFNGPFFISRVRHSMSTSNIKLTTGIITEEPSGGGGISHEG